MVIRQNEDRPLRLRFRLPSVFSASAGAACLPLRSDQKKRTNEELRSHNQALQSSAPPRPRDGSRSGGGAAQAGHRWDHGRRRIRNRRRAGAGGSLRSGPPGGPRRRALPFPAGIQPCQCHGNHGQPSGLPGPRYHGTPAAQKTAEAAPARRRRRPQTVTRPDRDRTPAPATRLPTDRSECCRGIPRPSCSARGRERQPPSRRHTPSQEAA